MNLENKFSKITDDIGNKLIKPVIKEMINFACITPFIPPALVLYVSFIPLARSFSPKKQEEFCERKLKEEKIRSIERYIKKNLYNRKLPEETPKEKIRYYELSRRKK